MCCLLDMIVFDVGNNPHISGVFPARISRDLAPLRTLKILLVWVFLRNADRIDIKNVLITLGEPEDCLIPA